MTWMKIPREVKSCLWIQRWSQREKNKYVIYLLNCNWMVKTVGKMTWMMLMTSVVIIMTLTFKNYSNSLFGPSYTWLFFLHGSCVPFTLTILRSYLMNWDLHLSCWILENSQIAWILGVALALLFFMLSIQHSIMCHRSLLVCLSLIRKS